MKPSIRLIVGLGNPGEKYIGTRHNAGADFVSAVAKLNAIELKADKKVAGRIGRGIVNGQDTRLLIPDTFMNHSGKAVGLAAKYFQISPSISSLLTMSSICHRAQAALSLMADTAVIMGFAISFQRLAGVAHFGAYASVLVIQASKQSIGLGAEQSIKD